MLDCNIKFKGVDYTNEEFRDFILENGIGVLQDSEAPSTLAQKLIDKYDITKMEESTSEM